MGTMVAEIKTILILLEKTYETLIGFSTYIPTYSYLHLRAKKTKMTLLLHDDTDDEDDDDDAPEDPTTMKIKKTLHDAEEETDTIPNKMTTATATDEINADDDANDHDDPDDDDGPQPPEEKS
jgi:hypothetical protein